MPSKSFLSVVWFCNQVRWASSDKAINLMWLGVVPSATDEWHLTRESPRKWPYRCDRYQWISQYYLWCSALRHSVFIIVDENDVVYGSLLPLFHSNLSKVFISQIWCLLYIDRNLVFFLSSLTIISSVFHLLYVSYKFVNFYDQSSNQVISGAKHFSSFFPCLLHTHLNYN